MSDAAVLRRHAVALLQSCACVQPGERLLLIFDETTHEVELLLREAADRLGVGATVVSMEAMAMHGVEPPAHVVKEMERSDVIVALTRSSLAHTMARFDATRRGARYLSLPQYGLKQLERPSLGVDFTAYAATGKALKALLDAAHRVHIITEKGTDLELDISGRLANWAPGFCNVPGMLGSPPDIETNVAPIETRSAGILIVDGSVPCEELGLLQGEIRLAIEDGRIVEIDGGVEGDVLARLLGDSDPARRVLAEFGVGLNPEARLCGLMLEDEGALGTVHFGFGSNATIGGQNATSFHLDMVVRNPMVTLDGRPIMVDGTLRLPAL